MYIHELYRNGKLVLTGLYHRIEYFVSMWVWFGYDASEYTIRQTGKLIS